MVDEYKRPKIAYVTSEDPHSRRSWSGTTYYMARALEKHCGDVSFIGPIISFEKRIIGRLMQEASKRLLKKNSAYDRFIFVAQKQSNLTAQKLAGQEFDVIFAPIGVPEVAFLETNIPIIIALDVSFALQRNYYPLYSNLLKSSIRQGEIVEQMAYKKASALLYSSEWAARSALVDYNIPKEKIEVLSLGANIDHIPTRTQIEAKKRSEHCRLLFMGIGWERKGGDIAFETLLKLEEMGIEAELIVCGSTPPSGITHKHMTIIPFLDKNNEEERREIERLYASADFLFIPTRADCTPVSFCEANAYGLPVITTFTGGVSDVVRNGVNGYTLPLDARGEEYANLIASIYQQNERFLRLVSSSRAEYEDRLNWDVWGIRMAALIEKLISPVPVSTSLIERREKFI